MYAVTSQHEESLRSQLRQARERLDGLVRDLHAVDGELEGLATKRKRYRLLHQACGALEELDALGAAGLFWGERVAPAERDAVIRQARGRTDAFEKQLGEIEERRQAIVEEIELAQESADLIADDVLEAQRLEEQRKRDWIVEREVGGVPVRPSIMPWTHGGEEDQRFRRALAASLLISLLLGVLLPLVELPIPEPGEPIEVPDRFARLIREERPPPPPPVLAETKPEEVEVTSEKKPDAKPSAKPKDAGILAFREKFSGLAATRTSARLGAQARISESGRVASGLPERSLVTTQAPGSSGGINLASLSRDVGGGNGTIDGVQVARATSSIGSSAGSDRPLSDGPAMARTDEEIQIVFDRYKAALYRLYNRELRRDPTLKGQMVLRIRIEPDGSVSLCELQSTDMEAPQLTSQVVERVRTFDFGAKDVPPVTIVYPIDFLPAA